MLVSVCGTPGTGKTTASDLLKGQGWEVVGERSLINDLSLFEDVDRESDEMIVDPEVVSEGFSVWAADLEKDTVIEGHLSYLAPSELVLLLRLDPRELERRLQTRGYEEEKTRDNVEAEVIGYLLTRCMEEEEMASESRGAGARGKRKLVLERDVTGMTPEEIASWFMEMIEACKGKELNIISRYRPGKVDWLEAYTKWF